MSLAVLFDLDDTLLQTNVNRFMLAYFKSLGRVVSHDSSEEVNTQQIINAFRLMAKNHDPATMLDDIFYENVIKPHETSKNAYPSALENFFNKDFQKLKLITQKKAQAYELINWCKSNGMTLALATNPLFPEVVTRQRIEWAGLNPDDFILFSTYNNFHFTKPNLTFYAEVLGRMGWPEEQIAMVGDNVMLDLQPMEAMGYPTFWVNSKKEPAINRPHGSLSEVKPWLESLPKKDTHRKTSHPFHLAILRSTPAVMDTWLREIPDSKFRRKAAADEWSVLEIFWHLADMEKEIYEPQWKQLLSDPSQPILPVDTGSWAEERNYQSLDVHNAFTLFLQARMGSLSLIESLVEKNYLNLSVRHSFLNQITISELICSAAKHDRLHLRQCFNLLNFYKNY